MTIGENVKRLRAAKGLSQPGLAKLSGVSQQLISQIENDKNGSTKYLPALARALAVRVQEIDPNYADDAEVEEMTAAFTALDPEGRKRILADARELREKGES